MGASEPKNSVSTPAVESPERGPPPHFSWIRSLSLADGLTLLNACCGVGALFYLLAYRTELRPSLLWRAFALFPLALLCDVLDGRVARYRRQASTLGIQLDSLADVISFGVAPACLGYALGLDGVLDIVALLFFVCCGVGRLARYNISADRLSDEHGKVRYFEGLPIPSSILIVGGLALAALNDRIGERLWWGRFEVLGLSVHPWVGLYVASGVAMVSRTLRIPKW